VRERCEIATRSHRPLRRNDRQHVGVVELDQRIDEYAAHARIAARQRRDLERERQPHHRGGQRIAYAHRMRQHEVTLQQLELLVGNVGLRKPPKACVHAISGLAALHDLGHGGRASLDGGVRSLRNRKPDSAARQFAQGAEIQGIADCEHRAMMPEITRGLARMRASLEQGSPSWQPLVWPHSLVLERPPSSLS
jgi:hypothetical protein